MQLSLGADVNTVACDVVNAPARGKARVRVLQLTSSLGFYGAEQMIMTLLTALDRDSFHVSLAALQKKKASSTAIVSAATAAGIEAVTVPCRGWLDWDAIQALKSLIERENIDILHCHEPKSRLYGAVVSKMMGIPIVATHHLWTGQNLRTRLVESIDAAVLHGCDKVVGVSNSVAESMRRVLVSSHRIEVIPNGIDLSSFRDDLKGDEVRRSLGIPRTAPVIGAVGRLDIQKGHDRLIEAAKKITDAGQEAFYVILGEGVERPRLEALVRDLGLTGRVLLPGYRSDVRSCLAMMDVFVMPSRREGTPMALLEAMAMKKPVVATAVGGVPDVLTDGIDGIVLPENGVGLSDALLKLLRDPAFAIQIARTGRRRVENEFSSVRMARRYEELYRRCLILRGQPALASAA
jgi:glycosyltransferase involved in cell wall biosynthesis